jgi:hypothetical protein
MHFVHKIIEQKLLKLLLEICLIIFYIKMTDLFEYTNDNRLLKHINYRWAVSVNNSVGLVYR